MRFILSLCLLCTGCGLVEKVGDWFSPDSACETANGGCDSHATCQLQEEKPICTCHADYMGDGKSCQPKPTNPAVALTSADNYTCAVSPDGALRCWGNLVVGRSGDIFRSTYPTATRIGEGQEWLTISAASIQFCGINKTGTVSCWSGLTQAPVPLPQVDSQTPDGKEFVSLSTGAFDVCAINASGELWCWTGFTEGSPVQLSSALPWSSVLVRNQVIYALRNDNTLWRWITRDRSAPDLPKSPAALVEVDPSRHWLSLSTGEGQVCAIDDRGALFCLRSDGSSLQQMNDQVGWTRVASDREHLCALKKDGTVWCQGQNSRGEAGGDISDVQRDSFEKVNASSAFESVSVGEHHSCASTATGEVWCWGDDSQGQLGDDHGASMPVLRKVPLTLPAMQVSAGMQATCVIDQTNARWCWGWNVDGDVGDGTGISRPTPVRVGTEQWRSIRMGFAAAGIQQNGSLWTWGGGQRVPSEVDHTHEWSTASGAYGVSALDTDGVLWQWVGSDYSRQLDGRWKQFAESRAHLCAIGEDDSLWCEGSNQYGELGTGTTEYAEDFQPVSPDSSWSVIAAYENRTCGIQTDGSLLCWGRALLDSQQDAHLPAVVPGTESFHWKAVDIGSTHACALREDSTIWCWGQNPDGQLGTRDFPDGTSVPQQVGRDGDWDALSVGAAHTCALRHDGSVWCWGANDSDELGDGSNARSEPVLVIQSE